MIQQVVNSPDDFDAENFYNQKFDHEARGSYNTSYMAAAEQVRVGPM